MSGKEVTRYYCEMIVNGMYKPICKKNNFKPSKWRIGNIKGESLYG
jgi:hypothetical protein